MKKKIILLSLSFIVLGIVFLNSSQKINAFDHGVYKHTLTKICEAFVEKGKSLQYTQPKEFNEELVVETIQVPQEQIQVQEQIQQPLVIDCYGSGNCNGVSCQNVDCPYFNQNTNDPNNQYYHRNNENAHNRGGHGCRNAY